MNCTSRIKEKYIKFILPKIFIKWGVIGIVITFDTAKQEKIKPITYSVTPLFKATNGKSGAIKEYPTADKTLIMKSKIISFFILLIL